MEILMEHLGKGFLNMLLISMPIVLVAAGIGLVVGILQAVTQVQEQTIAAAPKILGVFLALMLLSGFFMKVLTEYVLESFNLAFNVVTKQDDFILPPLDETPKKSFLDDGKNYQNLKRPGVDYIMKNPGKVPYASPKDKFSMSRSATAPSSQPNLVEKKKLYGR